MKIVRVLVIILFIAALASIGAYFYSKRSTNSSVAQTDTTLSTETARAGQQTPSAAVVFSNTTPTREIVIETSEYKFNPSTITIKKGESVKITLKNLGQMPHDWFVENMGGASIDMTNAGGTNSIVLRASQKGTFTTYCSIGSHRKLGMVGKLIVE